VDRRSTSAIPKWFKDLKSNILVFKSTGDTPEIPDEWESLSLMLTDAISHLEAQSVP